MDMIPIWLSIFCAALVLSYAASLTFWSYRVLIDRHPLDEAERMKSSWFGWISLTYALLGAEVPTVTTIIVALCSVCAWVWQPYIAYACVLSTFFAMLFYMFSERRDIRRSKARRTA